MMKTLENKDGRKGRDLGVGPTIAGRDFTAISSRTRTGPRGSQAPGESRSGWARPGWTIFDALRVRRCCRRVALERLEFKLTPDPLPDVAIAQDSVTSRRNLISLNRLDIRKNPSSLASSRPIGRVPGQNGPAFDERAAMAREPLSARTAQSAWITQSAVKFPNIHVSFALPKRPPCPRSRGLFTIPSNVPLPLPDLALPTSPKRVKSMSAFFGFRPPAPIRVADLRMEQPSPNSVRAST